MNLCAERVAALRMYADSGQMVVKRMIAFRDAPPSGGGSGMPCGACREFFMQLPLKNKDMEIMVDYEKRSAVTLAELMPAWWGTERYEKRRGEIRLLTLRKIYLYSATTIRYLKFIPKRHLFDFRAQM